MFGKSKQLSELMELNTQQRGQIAILEQEITGLRREKMALGDKIRDLEYEAKHQKEVLSLEHDRKIMQLQRDMQKSLIESDLTRVEAMAKLEIYQKTDSREDANTIKSMVKQLIDSIGKQNVNVIK